MTRTTDETCVHCQQDYDLKEALCDDGMGLLHCENHRGQCAQCHEMFCRYGLIQNEEGELLCNACYIMLIDPVVQAARRAAATGNHRDLKAYLKVRRHIA